MPKEDNPSLPIITGTVVHGDKVGRTIGFPTANVQTSLDETQLKPGVYVATCHIDPDKASSPFWGLAYFGPRLIFGETVNSFEVYLYDFTGDLYGATIKVKLLSFIRKPLPFTSLENLRNQLELDKQQGLSLRGSITKLP